MNFSIYFLSIKGGPAVFVLSWAVIKAYAVEPKNLSIAGVSHIHEKLFLIL